MSNGIPLLILICCSPPAEATSFHICYRHLRFYRGDFYYEYHYRSLQFLWGDLITLPLPGGSSIGISLLVLLLVPAGIYFTIRTRFVLIRKFPHMIQIAMEKTNILRRAVFPDFRLSLLPLPPVSAWAIWSALSLLFLPAVPVRYSGCGFLLCLAPPLLLQRAHWLRSTARRIRSTAATAAVRPTTSTIL